MPLDKQVQTAEPQACASGVCSPACTDLGSEVPDTWGQGQLCAQDLHLQALHCPAVGVHLQEPCTALHSLAD